MQNLEQWNDKFHWKCHFIFFQHKKVRKQNIFFVTVQDKQPKTLLLSMVLILPFKLTFGTKLYFKATSSQRLSIGINLDSGNVMNKFVKNFPEFGKLG